MLGSLDWLLQITETESESFCILMSLFGHDFTHAPQPVHLFLSTSATPRLLIEIAPKRQARLQSPQPRQANLQAFEPE